MNFAQPKINSSVKKRKSVGSFDPIIDPPFAFYPRNTSHTGNTQRFTSAFVHNNNIEKKHESETKEKLNWLIVGSSRGCQWQAQCSPQVRRRRNSSGCRCELQRKRAAAAAAAALGPMADGSSSTDGDVSGDGSASSSSSSSS